MTPRSAIDRLWAMLGCLGLFAAVTPAVAEDPKRIDQETLQVIVLTADKPVLLHLSVHVNGKPYREAFDAAWSDYLSHLFRFLDRDADGTLGPEEAERMPAPFSVLPGEWYGEQIQMNFAFNFRVVDRNNDGKVNRDELKEYYSRYAGASFQARSLGAFAGNERVNRVLLTRLDQNQDGSLSKEEVDAAATRLLPLDANGDGAVTASELGGGNSPQQIATTEVTNPTVLVFSPNRPPNNLPDLLFARYGSGPSRIGKTTLSQKDLKLPQETFTRLDRDQDGELDSGELMALAKGTPDFNMTVKLGETAADAVAARDGKRGRTEFHASNSLIEIQQNVSKIRFLPADPNAYLEQLGAGGKAEASSLDRKPAMSLPFFAANFDVIDRDADGKVTTAELRQYLDEVHSRHLRVLASRPAVVFSTEGRGLFDLLDSDRDGRLSRREMRSAPIGPIPAVRSFRIGVGLGQGSLAPYGGNLITLPYDSDRSDQGVGPIWFRKMDRNRDGDVSPAEFLGTPDDFRRLDTDGDGLISAEEAEKAEKR